MAVRNSDVVEAYEVLLGRPPEGDDVIRFQAQASKDHAELVRNIASSSEAKERLGIEDPVHEHHIFRGYSKNDLGVIRDFDTYQGNGEAGFVINFLGCRYRTTFSAALAPHSGRVEGYPLPVGSFQGETAEFIGVLRSVLEARNGRYRMLECGAGYGTWMALAHAATRQKGLADIHVYGIEGDAGHFAFLQQHMADNDITSFTALQGAVGSEAGTVDWPVPPDASADYSCRPLDEAKDYRDSAPVATVAVEMFSLSSILDLERVWDLVHMDIQGGEGDLCRNCVESLNERVRRVIVGTHSRALDGLVMATFHAAGWSLENEKPTIANWRDGATSLEAMAAVDGVQVWWNPKL